MARSPRYVLPGQPQHVIQRGNNRAAVFGTVADYRFYLEKLHAAVNKHRCEIHAYVLMNQLCPSPADPAYRRQNRQEE